MASASLHPERFDGTVPDAVRGAAGAPWARDGMAWWYAVMVSGEVGTEVGTVQAWPLTLGKVGGTTQHAPQHHRLLACLPRSEGQCNALPGISPQTAKRRS
jgi:hypothetical protein